MEQARQSVLTDCQNRSSSNDIILPSILDIFGTNMNWAVRIYDVPTVKHPSGSIDHIMVVSDDLIVDTMLAVRAFFVIVKVSFSRRP